jgi:hypothetical protein
MLVSSIDDIKWKQVNEDLEGLQDAVVEEYGSEQDKWLQQVKARLNIVKESGQVKTLMLLYNWVNTKYTGKKIIIFSSRGFLLQISNSAIMV